MHIKEQDSTTVIHEEKWSNNSAIVSVSASAAVQHPPEGNAG